MAERFWQTPAERWLAEARVENERLRKDLGTIRDFAQECWGADYYTYEEYGDIANMCSEALVDGLGEKWWNVAVARDRSSEAEGREEA